MSVNLQYNYAAYDVATGKCRGVMTFSYTFDMAGWVQIPVYTNDYIDKYYNAADGLWYLDAEFTQLWADAPEW